MKQLLLLFSIFAILLSARAADTHLLVEAGRPSAKVFQLVGQWNTEGGFFKGAKSARFTTSSGIGPGDFRITARVRLNGMKHSASGLYLGPSFFGFEGAHGKIFLTGKLFGDARGLPIGEPGQFMKDDVPFALEVTRTGKRLRFLIDGRLVHERAVTAGPVGHIGFNAMRATLAVSDLRVTGEFSSKHKTAAPGEAPYRMKTLPGVNKVVLLPPGPGNPRNSEGDFVQLKDGRVMFVYSHFTGGGSDHAAAHLTARYSSDNGKTWSKKDELVVSNEGGFNVMSVSLLRLQDGTIGLFYLRKNSLTDCRPLMRVSSDEGMTWSRSVEMITNQIGYYVMNNDRMIQLKTGRLVAPIALHNTADYEKPDWAGKIMSYISDNNGRTWRRSESVLVGHKPDGMRVTLQEPGVVELKDGRLLMWMRTDAGSQYQCWSSDGGVTWSQPQPGRIISPRSPATIERIPGKGDLLLVWNDHSKIAPELNGKRTPFSVALSSDDGKSWRLIETLENDPNGWYCYTAMDFVNGRVLLGHCGGDRRAGGLNTTQITSFDINWLYKK